MPENASLLTGIDAVFSVLTQIGTLDEAFRGAFDNIQRTSRNVAATLQIGMRSKGDIAAQTLYTSRRS